MCVYSTRHKLCIITPLKYIYFDAQLTTNTVFVAVVLRKWSHIHVAGVVDMTIFHISASSADDRSVHVKAMGSDVHTRSPSLSVAIGRFHAFRLGGGGGGSLKKKNNRNQNCRID